MRYYPRDMKFVILLTTTLLLTHLAHLNAAELKLAALFSDHMVLQREKPVSVWGWADADEKLTVEFGGQKKAAAADASGKWQVKLDPLPASVEPRTLLVQSAELAGFVVAGSDKQWKPARARISGSKVIVSSAEVANPVAVRYAWAPNPVCNLFNGAGLPASPFRTDDWPVDESATKQPASAK